MNNNRRRIMPLSQAVANRIAAGEVVERPAAVVKELVENSIDAGADHIKIIIRDSGRTLIQIVDNGFGMSEEDLKIAIGRHATSKLTQFEDLESLTTFGFRGEAIPSIAAVSRLEVTSRTSDSDIGTRLKITGGEIESCEPTSTSIGTTISVSHLFFNVPARRKFLRTDSTEFKWIAATFKQFALAFPGISWELYRGNDQMYELPACSYRERISGLFGDDIAEEMIEIEHEREWLKVTGFISPPSITQRNKDSQFLFINKRPIQHGLLNHGIYAAIEPYFVSGGHPIYIMLLEASPDHFDINVHPTKKQVKFVDESKARSIVWSAVRNAVTNRRVPDEFSNEDRTSSGHTPPRNVNDKVEEVPIKAPPHLKPYTPIPRQYKAPAKAPTLPFPENRERFKDESSIDPSSIFDELPKSESKQIELYDKGTEEMPQIWQAFDTFLISPVKSGLAFIDQHIAHERILYEKALTAMEKTPWDSQNILFPVTITVEHENVDLIEMILPLLQSMGFTIERFGPRDFRVLSVPAGIRISDEHEMVMGIFEEMCQDGSLESDPRKKLAASFACKAAIKAGQTLKPKEMQRLIEELFQTEDPEFCPHGRPIYHVLNRRDIEKWFKR